MAAAEPWRCGLCSLTWPASLIKCKACESFKPGLSEADVAAIQAEEERQKQESVAKFRQPIFSAAKPTGFSVPITLGSSGAGSFSFGFGTATGTVTTAAAPLVSGGGPVAAGGAVTSAPAIFGVGSAAVSENTSPMSGVFGLDPAGAGGGANGLAPSSRGCESGGFAFGSTATSSATSLGSSVAVPTATSAAPITFGFGARPSIDVSADSVAAAPTVKVAEPITFGFGAGPCTAEPVNLGFAARPPIAGVPVATAVATPVTFGFRADPGVGATGSGAGGVVPDGNGVGGFAFSSSTRGSDAGGSAPSGISGSGDGFSFSGATSGPSFGASAFAAGGNGGGGGFSFINSTISSSAAVPVGSTLSTNPSGSSGFGAGCGFQPAVAAAQGKDLAELPDFACRNKVPLGDVFVHGSGECDQLGLGDAQRERKKPTLVKGLEGQQICDLAVGALHVVCLTVNGRLYSWGCNDDGALGRSAESSMECKPHPVAMPHGVVVRKVSCGDNHTSALDSFGRVWLWGTYKDSNGHIGIARKRKQQGEVCEKSAEPAILLEGCSQIASGANHTVALATGKVFAWGSNATGQLGLRNGAGCGFDERVVEMPADGLPRKGLRRREGGGSEVDGHRVVRLREASGRERSAASMPPIEVQQALVAGAKALILELPERDVPKPERQGLLFPQEVFIGDVDGRVAGVFASAECTFLTIAEGATYSCGLNGDGQVGLGFASMAVRTLQPLAQLSGACWLGGGLHSSAALVGSKVFTWGKADECGHGLGNGAIPVMEPREVVGLPSIRTLRCGGSHMLACSSGGDVFAWGCGLTYQLANRPRNFVNATDAEEDPEDELRPYCISSKQLQKRFVLLADGGAQHSVELAWDKGYGDLDASQALASVDAKASSEAAATAGLSVDGECQSEERPGKRRALAPCTEVAAGDAGEASTAEAMAKQPLPGEAGQAAAPMAEAEATGVQPITLPMLEANSEAFVSSICESLSAAGGGPMATADSAGSAMESCLSLLAERKDVWKCDTCSLTWDMDLLKCKACESFRPGLSEVEIAEMEAESERRRQESIAKFRQATSGTTKPTGFSVLGTAASGTEFTFGAASMPAATPAAPTIFGFGAQSAAGNHGASPALAATSAVAPSPFGVSVGPASGATSLGAFHSVSAAAPDPVVFGFGGAGRAGGDTPAESSTISFSFGTAKATSHTVSAAAPDPVVFGFGGAGRAGGDTPAESSTISFGFGTAKATAAAVAPALPAIFEARTSGAGVPLASGDGGGGFRPAAVAVSRAGKNLTQLPDFDREDQVPLGDVFVHGSGECDQLGLGDVQRERKKPTPVKPLSGLQVCDLAVGALHVVCVAANGQMYSWGCNDDGALGRCSDQNADCEPHIVPMPLGVAVKRVSCGDNHSCALDIFGRVWLWGTYKDSNGHIGIARKRKQQEQVCQMSAEPAIALEKCSQIASGANHTLALQLSNPPRVFSWGSNGTGQLGLQTGAGCGIDEIVIDVSASSSRPATLKAHKGGASEVEGHRVVRIREASGSEPNATAMLPSQVQEAISSGAMALIAELPEREVSKKEKQDLLLPQELFLGDVNSTVTCVFASAECSFLTVAGGCTYGCGLNGDGQVGLGFASLAVRTMRLLPQLRGASWLGGGLHASAALVGGTVYTWGKADETGHGLGASALPIMKPRAVDGLPGIRTLRCGGSHSLACSEAGDVFMWGCGLTYQLANRPRDSTKPNDADEDPEDELRPYQLSSKQLEARFVLLADGGAQHSVELAWTGGYGKLAALPAETTVAAEEARKEEDAMEEPPLKKRRDMEPAVTPLVVVAQDAPAEKPEAQSVLVQPLPTLVESVPVLPAPALDQVLATPPPAAQALPAPMAVPPATSQAAPVPPKLQALVSGMQLERCAGEGAVPEFHAAARARAEVLCYFAGPLLSEAAPRGHFRAALPVDLPPGKPQSVLWSPRDPPKQQGQDLSASATRCQG